MGLLSRIPSPIGVKNRHRHGCHEPAMSVVLERYQETGHGTVEVEVVLCREHTAKESPTNLDGVYVELPS